jgi:putative colanic acid biosynthesis UDP-glucose lipid carrier transferase
MVSTTSQINKFIEFIAVLGDLIILNLVLFFLLFFWEEVFVSLPFSCRVSWMMTSLSLCYLACSGSRGRVWDSRGIRPDQLVSQERTIKARSILTSFSVWQLILAKLPTGY